ncbi:hypothetical protein TNCV_1744071 [Trichonephila clavipes]|nr:hypothetical protein TNCV_1744071 [Trichonephila clavipes]
MIVLSPSRAPSPWFNTGPVGPRLKGMSNYSKSLRTIIPQLPQVLLPQNWGEIELNRSVTCMVLKATTIDRRHLALCHDEFRGH